MKNKGFFWTITIALSLACVYQLSFTWATAAVESDATDYGEDCLDSLDRFNVPYIVAERDTLYVRDTSFVRVDTSGVIDTIVPNVNRDRKNIANYYSDLYLKEQANEEIHWGYTYAECKENELNLGLDLKGGMSVTLELNIPKLVSELAGNTRNQTFRKAFDEAKIRTSEGQGDFIDLFREEFEKVSDVPMAKIFHMHNQDEVKQDASNEDIVDFLNNQASAALDGVEIIIEKRVNSFGVAQPTIQKQTGSNRIFVELPGVKDKESVRRRLQSTANLEFYEIYNNKFDGIGDLLLSAQEDLSNALYGTKDDTSSTPVIDDDPFNLDDTTTLAVVDDDTTKTDPADDDDFLAAPDGGNSQGGDDEMLGDAESTDATGNSAQLSRAEQERKYPLTSLMQLAFEYDEAGEPTGYREGSFVGYAQVKDTSTVSARLNHPAIRAVLPLDLRFMWDSKEMEDENGNPNGLVWIHAIKVPPSGPPVSGQHIDNSYVSSPIPGEFVVNMSMTNMGAEKWEALTEKNLKKQIAITMDDYVFSAPVVNEVMSSGRSEIRGGFSLYEANDLSGLLNAGALPAPVTIVDEAVVGPSIGEGNVTRGFWSFVVALSLVLMYMIFYYSRAGIIADFALVLNIFLLIGALSSMGAILTLPGIAGIVLTIGMSVDANVLIFERIREELRQGKGVRGAVKDGFQKALAAILDANITTLLTGIVLATFGTGPVKGFATTLIIGIFTSFFAAVVITRLIVTSFLDKDKKITFSTSITENWFTNTAIPFVRKRKLFYIVSTVIVLAGIGSLASRGLDWGVDFKGGRQYKVEFSEQEADNEAIIASLTKQFEGMPPSVKMVSNEYTALITTKYKITDPSTETNNEVEGKVKIGLKQFGDFEIVESKMIAPTISKDLKKNSLYAVGFSLVVIFLYILFRFRRWQYGLGALIAVAHDVLVVLAIFSICWGWIGFSMEIDQAFIAAILTVVGYSINDTVVVFDRIREYLGIYHKKNRKEVINMALNSTLSRTVNTSVSTFIVLLIIFLFGGDAIKGFTFALMVGVIVGTYSSLFIATPAVIDLSKSDEPKEIK
ncbi:protein translocase subunit SecDF [Crocinitomix catalasitica]|nr:protein translocase subunit SecDF [Crocinitomix catalasitica]